MSWATQEQSTALMSQITASGSLFYVHVVQAALQMLFLILVQEPSMEGTWQAAAAAQSVPVTPQAA
jgi:multidrug resistance efflux pump